MDSYKGSKKTVTKEFNGKEYKLNPLQNFEIKYSMDSYKGSKKTITKEFNGKEYKFYEKNNDSTFTNDFEVYSKEGAPFDLVLKEYSKSTFLSRVYDQWIQEMSNSLVFEIKNKGWCSFVTGDNQQEVFVTYKKNEKLYRFTYSKLDEDVPHFIQKTEEIKNF